MNTVLIVEDDSSLIRGLKDSFSQAGFKVLTAMDGEQGLHLAIVEPVDLILLDVMLPKMNGYEVCQGVREAQCDVPIIMLTAKGQEQDVVRGLNLGADDYVTKPFSIVELLARANAFLRSKKPIQEYFFGGFKVDMISRKLIFSGKEIPLTPKEFGLLALFISRENYALTRETILSAVWGSSVLTTLRSVDRCVTTLRTKLKKYEHCASYIKSIRDVGYRFDGEGG